ncbi:aldo/keto reductase family protein [Geobacillus kaustophilus]|uniref:Aldo/keto reductase family protein n=1 Tax=Geobacillus kaustophilus TaxID=1462 RepID=A0A0D8BND6_GEOKU|nr:aldo/keto reductase [Geobacillus kaustophilus]KJE25640.1 aldo/keto reductase family protein [Geobacillus kaustophilus]
MQYCQLGNTDLQVSALSFGTWAIGGSWGNVDDLEFQKGVDAGELRWIANGRGSMAKAALRWVIDHEEVTCAIPGFKTVKQVKENLDAIHMPPFTEAEKERLRQFYWSEVHPHIRGAY